MRYLLLCTLLLTGCGATVATKKGAHDLAVTLPAIFDHGDAQDKERACRLAAEIDEALNR